jgi:hypothetical protein
VSDHQEWRKAGFGQFYYRNINRRIAVSNSAVDLDFASYTGSIQHAQMGENTHWAK